jgi:hypothetical protein
MTKNLTPEGREMVDNLASLLPKEKISLDIVTRSGVTSIPLEDHFTGKIVLDFYLGGYTGAVKHVKIK